MRLSPARKQALRLLIKFRERNAYIKELMKKSEAFSALSSEDRSFCALLCVGVVSCQGSLDQLINLVLSSSQKISPTLRDILRLACYELFYLKKDPHVVVSQAVELTKAHVRAAAGLSNALLHRLSELQKSFPFGDPYTDDQAFCLQHGFPLELYELMVQHLGRAHAAILVRAQDSPAPLFVSSLPQLIEEEDIQTLLQEYGITASPLIPLAGSWLIHDAVKFFQAGLMEEKGLIVMDYSAQIVAAIAAGDGKQSILEVGSGRGTKSAAINSRILRQGRIAQITALDIHAYKSRMADMRLKKLQIDTVKQVTANGNSEDELRALGSYGTVFVDAPCSGTGTLRRNPELVWTTSLEKIKSLTQLQLSMLKTLSTHVAPKGELIYSTCSVMPHENERLIENFLQTPEGKRFKRVAVYERKGLTAAEAKALQDHCTPEGYLKTFPTEGGADGHFCARLKLVD